MNLKKSQPAPDEASESLTGGSPVKLLLVGGGVIGLAAAGALAFVLLSGGDEPVSTATAPVPVPVPTATAPTETATPTTSASIPTYAAKNARDPFKALVTQTEAAKAAASATTTPVAWTPPPAPPATSTTTPPRTTSPSTTTAPDPVIPYDVNVVVLSKIVDGTTVQIYADDKPYTLKVGEVSTGPLQLKSVDTVGKAAVVQYGDVLVTLPLRQVVILQQP